MHRVKGRMLCARSGLAFAQWLTMQHAPIEQLMTADPVCVNASDSMGDAYRLMLRLDCRHLPVLKAGRLAGVVSLGKLYRYEPVSGLLNATRAVAEVADEAYAVERATPAAEVAAAMARRRVEAAIVVDKGRVVGIFTAVDALRALAAQGADKRDEPWLTNAS